LSRKFNARTGKPLKLNKHIQTMAYFQLTFVFLLNQISPGVIVIGNTST